MAACRMIEGPCKPAKSSFQSINRLHIQHHAGRVQGVSESQLSMNLCPELGLPNFATTSESLNPPLRN